jgi:hypothetical protein
VPYSLEMSHPHLDRLHDLDCVACYLLGTKTGSGIQVHHLESVRDELSHYAGVSLCVFHHSELHRLSRRGFERQTKLTPIDLLAGTIKLLCGD